MEKSLIRNKILNIRNSLSEDECMMKSAAILKRLYGLDAFLRAYKVGMYASIGSEVITYPLIGRAQILDKGVAFPEVTDKDKSEMIFKYIMKVSDLKKGYMSIPEPKDSKTVMEHPDVLIIPLVAFDDKLNRVGYGKGFYDRYLSSHPEIVKIGLAYECQKTEEIDFSENDVKCDFIITEERVYER